MAEGTIPDEFPRTGDVTGSRVVITGASRGLGRTLAFAFARAGARLMLVSRSAEDLDGLVQSLPGEHGSCPGDVSDPIVNEQIAAAAVERLGGLDVWIANAGISPVVAATTDMDPKQWRRIIDTNLNGAFYGIRAAAAVMRPGGRVIITGSVLGTRPRGGLSAYSAAKAGLEGLVKSAALDLADRGVTVNLVAPGWFVSPLTEGWRNDPERDKEILSRTPLGRWGTSSDLPGAYVFLASPAARFITGVTIPVDGGYLAH